MGADELQLLKSQVQNTKQLIALLKLVHTTLSVEALERHLIEEALELLGFVEWRVPRNEPLPHFCETCRNTLRLWSFPTLTNGGAGRNNPPLSMDDEVWDIPAPQLEVLRWLAVGLSLDAIDVKLKLGKGTAKSRIALIRKRIVGQGSSGDRNLTATRIVYLATKKGLI